MRYPVPPKGLLRRMCKPLFLRLGAAAIVAAFAATSLPAATSGAAPAQKDPGRWKLVTTTSIRIFYYQGMTQDDQGHFFFDGVEVPLKAGDRLENLDRIRLRAPSQLFPFLP